MANKQIQISTVKQTADVEVIFVNASLISKAIRSSMAIHNMLDKCTTISPVYKTDEEGQPVKDETGTPVVIGENKSYNTYHIKSADIEALDTVVASFLDELCKAFEE